MHFAGDARSGVGRSVKHRQRESACARARETQAPERAGGVAGKTRTCLLCKNLGGNEVGSSGVRFFLYQESFRTGVKTRTCLPYTLRSRRSCTVETVPFSEKLNAHTHKYRPVFFPPSAFTGQSLLTLNLASDTTDRTRSPLLTRRVRFACEVRHAVHYAEAVSHLP